MSPPSPLHILSLFLPSLVDRSHRPMLCVYVRMCVCVCEVHTERDELFTQKGPLQKEGKVDALCCDRKGWRMQRDKKEDAPLLKRFSSSARSTNVYKRLHRNRNTNNNQIHPPLSLSLSLSLSLTLIMATFTVSPDYGFVSSFPATCLHTHFHPFNQFLFPPSFAPILKLT